MKLWDITKHLNEERSKVLKFKFLQIFVPRVAVSPMATMKPTPETSQSQQTSMLKHLCSRKYHVYKRV